MNTNAYSVDREDGRSSTHETLDACVHDYLDSRDPLLWPCYLRVYKRELSVFNYDDVAFLTNCTLKMLEDYWADHYATPTNTHIVTDRQQKQLYDVLYTLLSARTPTQLVATGNYTRVCVASWVRQRRAHWLQRDRVIGALAKLEAEKT